MNMSLAKLVSGHQGKTRMEYELKRFLLEGETAGAKILYLKVQGKGTWSADNLGWKRLQFELRPTRQTVSNYAQ